MNDHLIARLEALQVTDLTAEPMKCLALLRSALSALEEAQYLQDFKDLVGSGGFVAKRDHAALEGKRQKALEEVRDKDLEIDALRGAIRRALSRRDAAEQRAKGQSFNPRDLPSQTAHQKRRAEALLAAMQTLEDYL